MSCICQYFTPIQNSSENQIVKYVDNGTDEKTTQSRSDISATEMVNSRAEVWVLRKQLKDAEISIENLEKLLTTIVDKQRVILSEIHAIRAENMELQSECRLQRDYHAMERNALMRELHEVKISLHRRSCALEDSESRVNELTYSLQEANKKIYAMGMRFLKYKSTHSLKSGRTASLSQVKTVENTLCSSD